MTTAVEFTERELTSLQQENTGTSFRRAARISDRAMQARIDAALKESRG